MASMHQAKKVEFVSASSSSLSAFLSPLSRQNLRHGNLFRSEWHRSNHSFFTIFPFPLTCVRIRVLLLSNHLMMHELSTWLNLGVFVNAQTRCVQEPSQSPLYLAPMSVAFCLIWPRSGFWVAIQQKTCVFSFGWKISIT